jgi:hypothetical protein
MSGGGKGGSQSTSVQVPAWLENAAQQNLGRANQVSQLGYTPYFGPDVAAMTPMQIAAMQGTNQAASAFGLPTADPMAGMPQAQDYGGMSAYSSAPMFEQSVAALRANAPGQASAMAGMFIDPMTGQTASQPMAQQPAQMAQQPAQMAQPPAQKRNRTSTSASVMPMGAPQVGQGGIAGYSGLPDMFDGGGAGQKGDTFQGGLMADYSNFRGRTPVSRSGGGSMGGGK